MLRWYFLLFILMGLPMLAANTAHAASADDARQYVDSVGKQVLAVLDGKSGEAEKHKQLQQMFIERVDIDWMGKFVLGHGWQDASDAQRSRYMAAYRQYLLARYTTNFEDYTGSKYTITGVKSDSDGEFTVSMQIKSPQSQQQETDAGYRIHTVGGGQFKIIDIIIEGVSLITTQRSDFASALQQKGIDALTGDLEAKARVKTK